jgi:Methyltransferase domain
MTTSQRVIHVIKYVMPYGLVHQIRRSYAVRKRRITALNIAAAPIEAAARQIPYSYSAAIEFHCAAGLPRGHVIGGSMPESALAFCTKTLDELIPRRDNRALIGLHVGNFLGVSLSHFVNYVRQRNERSVVVSIDPNLTHRGIESPQRHVVAILNYFGLQRNAIVCVGYSTNKTVSNDGMAFVDTNGNEYDPYTGFQIEQSCEDTLSNLCTIFPGRFDFAVVDGNHEGSYVRGEAALTRRLLKPEGVLILDDVSDAWTEIKAEYDGLQSHGWRAVAADGRVGVLQNRPRPGAETDILGSQMST